MLQVQPDQALTLSAIIAEGTFDAAARRLHLTPSAVSQRVRALEVAVGRPVLQRVRPVELTPAGEAVVRFARQLELLSGDLSAQLQSEAGGPSPRITLVVNSDSLHTWVLRGLVAVAEHVQLTLLREDQEHSLDLVRRGTVHGAITATAAPVPGCTSRRLGVMRYRPVCTPAFAARWFADGVTPTTLSAAPVVVYDDKDDLQDRYLRQRRTSAPPPRHHVPATHELGRAVQLSLGWAMLPDLQLAQLESDTLVPLTPSARLDVPLYWQQWRLTTNALDRVATAIDEAAQALERWSAGPALQEAADAAGQAGRESA